MIRIFLRSVRFGIATWELCLLVHHVGELAEQIVRIVRPRRSFGMVLHAEKRQGTMAKSLIGPVIQVDMRDFDVARGQRIRIHHETVILRGDFHVPGLQILDRVIRAVMAELQLVGSAAERQSAELVSQADAEDWHAPHQFANRLDRVSNRLGIARPVREENAVGMQCQHIFR